MFQTLMNCIDFFDNEISYRGVMSYRYEHYDYYEYYDYYDYYEYYDYDYYDYYEYYDKLYYINII